MDVNYLNVYCYRKIEVTQRMRTEGQEETVEIILLSKEKYIDTKKKMYEEEERNTKEKSSRERRYKDARRIKKRQKTKDIVFVTPHDASKCVHIAEEAKMP